MVVHGLQACKLPVHRCGCERSLGLLSLLVEPGIKPISEWPRIWCRMLQSLDVEELQERSANGEKRTVGRVMKLRFVDRVKVMELVGKTRGRPGLCANHSNSECECRLSRD